MNTKLNGVFSGVFSAFVSSLIMLAIACFMAVVADHYFHHQPVMPISSDNSGALFTTEAGTPVTAER